MAPTRVLDLRDTSEIGGPGKTILETHRAIDRSRFTLHLAVFATAHETGETPFVRAARDQGMNVHVLRGFNQYDPRLALRLSRLTAAEGIDIVHAHETKSDAVAFLAARLRRVVTITTLHGWIGNSPRQRALIALDRRIVRSFDRVIAVSDRIRQQLLDSGMKPDKVTLLHNAIVVERYRRTGQRGALEGIVGRPLESPVLISIGRLSPEKGHRDLVAALGLVAARGARVSAVLIGDGPERARLEEQVRGLGLADRVHLPGYLPAPERLLEDADLMVLPSYTEGLPNVVLESLMMEVPVLATRVGGTPEVLRDGESGRLVDPGRPDALAEGILSFLAHRGEWIEMARRGREDVRVRFNFETRTRRLEEIYTDLVRERVR